MQELGDADERHREGAEHVADGDALRHGGHWHKEAHRQTDGATHNEADDDELVAHDLVVQQGADDGEQHAERCELHAAARGVRLRQAAESKDERRRCADIGDLHEERADLLVDHFGASVFLNIFNMRSVMTKPPTTLIVAAATATMPMMLM